MEVVQFPIEKIIIEGRFRQEMGDIDELSQGIKEKGLLQPVTISASGRLLAGGRRVAAAQKAGLTSIPAIIREGDEIDALEVELIENIHRKDFTWHERAQLEKRINEMKTAQDPDWSQRDQARLLDVSVGAVNRRLQLAEYLEAIPDLKNMKNEDEAWKAVKKIEEAYMVDALTRQAEARGETKPDKDTPYHVWADSHYKIGDALEGLEKLNKKVFWFAEVDPPYAIALQDRKSRSKQTVNVADQYNEVTPDKYLEFLRRASAATFECLSENAFCIWWFGQEWYATVQAALIEAGFKVNSIPAIWYKGNTGQTASPDTMLGSSYETFFVCRKGSPKLARPGRSNVFHYPPLHPGKKIHPTEKPIELMVEILQTFLFPGSRFVCPFLGSGVTLRAAYRLNHLAFGWDLSMAYKRSFLQRVKEDDLLGVKPEVQKAVGE